MSPFSISEILSFALKSLIPFLYWRCFERFRTIKIYFRIKYTIHYRIKIQCGIFKSTSYLSHPLFCPMLAIWSEKKSSSSDFFRSIVRFLLQLKPSTVIIILSATTLLLIRSIMITQKLWSFTQITQCPIRNPWICYLIGSILNQ